MRINQYISQAGFSSRRGADKLIEEGKVKVNGKKIKKPGIQVDPSADSVEVMIQKNNTYSWKMLKPASEKVTYALYKPRGYITSMKRDTRDPIIKNLVPQNPRVFPVGRLDKESEGLILMTNDGTLSQKLMHPSTHVPKTYFVIVLTPKRITENALKSHLGRLKKYNIKLLKFEPERGSAQLEIVLHEGQNRQIRRMLGRINLEVIKLVRIAIDNMSLEDLDIEPGEYKKIEESIL